MVRYGVRLHTGPATQHGLSELLQPSCSVRIGVYRRLVSGFKRGKKWIMEGHVIVSNIRDLQHIWATIYAARVWQNLHIVSHAATYGMCLPADSPHAVWA